MAKKLYRSKTDRVFFGVCGGLAEYFEIDPVIVRLIVVLIALAGGFGILFYLLAALIIPEEPGVEEAKVVDKKKKETKKEEFSQKAEAAAQQVASEAKKQIKRGKSSQIFGMVLIALGVFFMLQMVFPWFDFGNFWWLILIAIGLVLLFGGKKSD